MAQQRPSEKDVHEIFRRLDTDRDGRLSIADLRGGSALLEKLCSKTELQAMTQEMEKYGKKSVTLQELCAMLATRKEGKEEKEKKVEEEEASEEEMRKSFAMFDVDGDGYVTAPELKEMMRLSGDDVTDRDVQAIIDEADIDGDRRISFEEFYNLMAK